MMIVSCNERVSWNGRERWRSGRKRRHRADWDHMVAAVIVLAVVEHLEGDAEEELAAVALLGLHSNRATVERNDLLTQRES